MMLHKNKTASEEVMALENKHGAHNYHPIPVVLESGKGIFVWDVEGKKYFDFLSAYSAVNQGHCHPRITEVIKKQVDKLTLTSRAFYNSELGKYEKNITELFGYDKVLPMNTGAEAVETGVKLARKWGYEKKGIASEQAKIIVFKNNFHGRTTTVISFSSDKEAKNNYGPYTPGFIEVEYNNYEALKEIVAKEASNICGLLIEPIQGEAGIIIPSEGYLKACYDLCKANNILFIADEIQTGIARTGKLLAVHYDEIQPDVLLLGKALSGGAYPVSAVLANDEIMEVFRPGQHGSTFGGNPLASAIAREALQIVIDENLSENAAKMGELFRAEMQKLVDEFDLFSLIRGKGLLNALVINDTPESDTAWSFCVALKENGLLAKPTHGNIIRLAPPLIITREQILESVGIIRNTVENFKSNKV